MFKYLYGQLYVRNPKKILLPKVGIILGRFGIIATCEVIFLITTGVYEASATRISLINSSESTCIQGKDACIKKISKDTLTEDEEVYTFLRIESLPGISSTEGYNTDASLVKSQATEKQQLSHSLKLSEVPIVNIGGQDYREFILNISEPGKTKTNPDLAKIVLEKLEIYLGNAPNLGNYPTFNGEASKTFDLDQNSVLLQDINSDRGGHDYFVYISNTFFTDSNKGAKKYVYLFSKFSDAEGRDVEWAVRKLDQASLLPTIPAGAGGSGGGILGSLIPFLGLSRVFGGKAANVSNYQNLSSPRTGDVTVPKLAKPPTDVPEPTTLLASLIGIGLLAKARSMSCYQRVSKDRS
jgi:hypothetical protein